MHSIQAAVLTLLLTTLACSSKSAAEQACFDTGEAVAKAAERCGQSYDANYDEFTKDCDRTERVRDEDALRTQCLPWFETVDCNTLLGGNLDPSCEGQLQRIATVPPTLQSQELPLHTRVFDSL